MFNPYGGYPPSLPGDPDYLIASKRIADAAAKAADAAAQKGKLAVRVGVIVAIVGLVLWTGFSCSVGYGMGADSQRGTISSLGQQVSAQTARANKAEGEGSVAVGQARQLEAKNSQLVVQVNALAAENNELKGKDSVQRYNELVGWRQTELNYLRQLRGVVWFLLFIILLLIIALSVLGVHYRRLRRKLVEPSTVAQPVSVVPQVPPLRVRRGRT